MKDWEHNHEESLNIDEHDEKDADTKAADAEPSHDVTKVVVLKLSTGDDVDDDHNK